MYYLTFPEDRPSNKVLVYSVFIMETMQTILLLYHGILMYSDPYTFKYLFSPAWSFIQWTAIPLLGGIVALAVQTFYAYRLHILACSWAIMILVILLALVQFALAIIGGCAVIEPGALFTVRYYTYSIAWATFSIACDLVIAIAMTYFLLRSDTGWKTTHTLLVKLVHLAIETGTVTVLIAAAYLIVEFQNKNFMVPLAVILGKVYSNAMMVNFNHRIQISGGQNESQIEGFM